MSSSPTSPAEAPGRARRAVRPLAPAPALLTRQHLASYLLQLGFERSPLDRSFHCAGLHVTLLDTPRLAVRAAGGLTYLSVVSLPQLEQQLAELGYQRPLVLPATGT